MHTVLRLLSECFTPLIALISGLLVFRKSSAYFRILLLQLLLWILTFFLSYVVTYWQQLHFLPLNNQFVFNWHILIETTLLASGAWVFLKHEQTRYIVLVLYPLFFLFWGFDYFAKGTNYFTHADLVSCCCLSGLYALIIYKAVQSETPWWKNAELFASSGIFLYFVTSIPYISAFDALQKNFPDLHEFLFYLISDILSNLRYLLLAIGFWLLNFKPHE